MIDVNQTVVLKVAKVYAMQDFWEPKSNTSKQRYLVVRDQSELESLKAPETFQVITLNDIEKVLGGQPFEIHLSRTAMSVIFYQAISLVWQFNTELAQARDELTRVVSELGDEFRKEKEGYRVALAELTSRVQLATQEAESARTTLQTKEEKIQALEAFVLSDEKVKKRKEYVNQLSNENAKLKKRVESLEVEVEALQAQK